MMKLYFTARDGSQAEITGDERAVRAIERIFHRSGIHYKGKVADEGYYTTQIMSIDQITTLLREQARLRAPENDEGGVLQYAADKIENDVAEL